ncbi:hypothetical protein Q5P01_000366 [Channa striata]|uniref:Uncharacterized protein n=1 Tax=Channa striata TaxID=64152 RepID=A0AA88LJ33_CHASR|nr:hypothetical protein Q5P01_000366 [Channa striata]
MKESNESGLRASKEGIQATSGPAAASCCLPNAPRHLLTTTIEHPQGKRQGQPQQAAAFLTLPGAGGLPDSRKHHTPGRLLSPLGYPGPERVSAVQKPPSRYPF